MTDVRDGAEGTDRAWPASLLRVLVDRPVLVVLGATAFMALAALWGIGTRSLWLDEGFTVMHARMPTGDFFEIIAQHEANAALHSVLVHGWIQVSEAAAWLRLPSALAATAAVPVVYLLGRRLFGPPVGAAAAVLLGVNGYLVEYGQEGRTYALLVLMSALSGWLFVRFLQEERTPTAVAWVLVTCLLGYAHFFGTLVVAAEVVALLARRGLPTPWRKAWIGVVVIGVAHLPLAAFFLAGGDKGQSEGVPELTPVRFVGAFSRLSGNLGIPLMALVAIACGAALLVLWRSRRRLDERAWAVLFLTLWVLVPIGSVALVSIVKPLFGARYFVEVIPALALLTAFGLTQLRPRWLQAGIALGIVALNLVAVVAWHQEPAREDARGVVERLAEEDGAQPGDAIAFVPWFGRIPVETYLEDDDDLVADLDPIYPTPTWGEWRPIDEPPMVGDDEPDYDAIVASAPADGRTWVVARAGDGGLAGEAVQLDDAFNAAGFERVSDESFDGLVLRSYER